MTWDPDVQEAVSTKQFAELAGVSPGTVSNALNRPGGKLSPAKMGRGRIDVDHPAATAYLESMARLKASYAAGRKKRGAGAPCRSGEAATPVASSKDTQKILDGLPKDIRDLADRPLRELVDQFGTGPAFVEFVKATREIERVHAQRLKNAKEEGQVVSRELVQRGVIDTFDLCFQRLLSDGVRTIATRVADMARAGETNEDCEKFMAGKITDFIKGVKATALGAIGGTS